jgi:uncharacterized protein (TIGR00730 family)
MPSHAIRRIAVFCGSAPGTDPRFMTAARALGAELAARGIGVVYGGANVGCMGAVADGALDAGGEVIGVLTTGLADREIAHPRLASLEIVATMHERKARMAALSDAAIALPGGYGTFDELFEALTWSQLGIDRKPIGLLDDGGYWAPLLALLDTATATGFLREANRQLLFQSASLGELLEQFVATTKSVSMRRDFRAPLSSETYRR